MFIIRHKNLFLGLTILLMVLSAVSIGVYGLNQGIDFKGGSVMEVDYGSSTRPSVDVLKAKVDALNFGGAVVQPVATSSLIVKTRSITEPERVALLKALAVNASTTLVQKQFNSIGPVVGAELRSKSFSAIAIVILLIVLYITFAFRKVSYPVASWKYGLIAVVTLLHDVLVPTGFFALYSHATGAEIDVLFVTAILAVLGFSIHDTIVVFDRIRENLRDARGKQTFAETVGKSLNETFTRSINTSLTVLLTLLVLYFVGGETTHNFALLLIVGIAAGTYSSIFFASPLLVEIEKWQKK